MAERGARRGISLDRILRVRGVQLGLVRAEEAQAHDRVASEAALKERIAQLAANVAPETARGGAFSLMAAAHYRDRLHQSAQAAALRERHAIEQAERAAEASRSARRDQSAIEKLIERRDAEEALRQLRALEEAPPLRQVRHDPC